jgi:hypothetical protein
VSSFLRALQEMNEGEGRGGGEGDRQVLFVWIEVGDVDSCDDDVLCHQPLTP